MFAGSTKMRLSLVAVVIVAGVSLAWTGPSTESARSEPSAAAPTEDSCQFAIRGSNNMSFDVWVMLYDSKVKLSDRLSVGVFGPSWKQMKIQNQRIRQGGTMDRRYTAAGKCSATREWQISVVKGDPSKISAQTVQITTRGSGSGSRTVDLGPSSTWGR